MISHMMDEPVSKYTAHKLLVIDSNIKISEAEQQMVKSENHYVKLIFIVSRIRILIFEKTLLIIQT